MKITLLLLPILLFSNLVIGQTTLLPDPNFEQALIDLGYDSGSPDGVVATSSIDTIISLNVEMKNISDLTGIENFIALTILRCRSNQLSNLNITQNVALTELDCSNNQLTNLNLAQNSLLSILYCFNNQLTSLNLMQNNNLSLFTCNTNDLICLNVKNGNNTNLTTFFDASNNPNLTCIEVDDVAFSTTNWSAIDPVSSFSMNCSNNCSVGINSIEPFSSLSISPNPTNGNISVDLGEMKSNLTATIRNNLGQIITTRKITSAVSFSINLNAPAGIYFLNVQTSAGESRTVRIIKA